MSEADGARCRVAVVQVASTPNPAVRRFVVSEPWLEDESLKVSRGDAVSGTSLPGRLLEDPRIESLLFGRDFVSVTAEPGAWRPGLEAGVTARIESEPLTLPLPWADHEAVQAEGDPELIYKIETLLDWEVRPNLAQHGGDVRVVRVADGVLTLDMRGACSACPSSIGTLHDLIEQRVRRSLPEIEAVVQVTG